MLLHKNSIYPNSGTRFFTNSVGNSCRQTTRSDNGFILLTLLWLLTGLSLIALTLAASVRFEASVTHANADAERAYFFAKGAIETVLYRIAFPYQDAEKQKQLFPYAAGMNHFWLTSDEMTCHVAILDEAGKIDLNKADEQTLDGLLAQQGVVASVRNRIVQSIIRWRKPLAGEESDNGAVPHRPFRSVEELLQVDGMTSSLLYRQPMRLEDGRTLDRPGLIDLLTVYPEKQQVNVNYASYDVLAALPGVGSDTARLIIQARLESAFDGANPLTNRIPRILRGDALSHLTTDSSPYFCLVATAMVKGSRVRRSIQVIAKKDTSLANRIDRLIWHDEFWPSSELLRWMEPRELTRLFESHLNCRLRGQGGALRC